MPNNENNVCRLCEGILVKKFNKKILNKYNIDYFECKTCYSLMSEKPYWLKEAYDDKPTYFDTGVFYRNWEKSFFKNTFNYSLS